MGLRLSEFVEKTQYLYVDKNQKSGISLKNVTIKRYEKQESDLGLPFVFTISIVFIL